MKITCLEYILYEYILFFSNSASMKIVKKYCNRYKFKVHNLRGNLARAHAILTVGTPERHGTALELRALHAACLVQKI